MSPRAAEGFTLLEVLVAVFIMALVISFAFQAYQGIAESYTRVSAVTSRDRAAHILVDRLERELVGAVMIEREKGADPLLHPFLFLAVPRSYGESTGFELRFVTQTPLRSPGSPPAALALVTYGTAPAKSGQGFDLLRQEEPMPTQLVKEVDWTGAQTVAENVADFRLGFSASANEESLGWDSTSVAQLDELPQFVEVTVALIETGPDGEPWPGLPIMRQVNLPVRPFRLSPEGPDEAKCGGGVTVAACLANFTAQIAAASPSLAAAINDAGAQAKDACWSEAPPSAALERLKSLMDGLHGFDPGEVSMIHGRDEEGVVLLLVLVLVVVAISTAYAMSKTSVIEVLSTRQYGQHERALMLARSGVGLGVRTLQDDLLGGSDMTRQVESDLDAWALLSHQEIELPGAALLRVSVRDAGAKVNINSLVDAAGQRIGETSKAFLKAAIAHIAETAPAFKGSSAYGDEDVDELSDAILDWLDKDEETRMGTPEEEYYVGIKKGRAAPLNRPVFSLDELASVPGLDALMLEALKAYFTTYPMYPPADGGGVNLNTAPPHVLGMIYHGLGQEFEMLDSRDVFQLLKAREERKVFCPAEGPEPCTTFFRTLGIAEGEQIFPLLTYKSRVFRIDSTVRIGETRACVSSVVDRGDGGGEMQTLYYKLGC